MHQPHLPVDVRCPASGIYNFSMCVARLLSAWFAFSTPEFYGNVAWAPTHSLVTSGVRDSNGATPAARAWYCWFHLLHVLKLCSLDVGQRGDFCGNWLATTLWRRQMVGVGTVLSRFEHCLWMYWFHTSCAARRDGNQNGRTSSPPAQTPRVA